MTKEEKTKVIADLVGKLNANNKVYLADCSSLSVEKINAFRRKCYAEDVTVEVVKNTLLEKALAQASDSRLAELTPVLKGATALIFTQNNAAPAKLIKEFRAKGGDKPKLKGAYIQETIFIGDDQLEALASIKSKNELIGEVIGLLQSPAKRILSALQNHAEKKEAA